MWSEYTELQLQAGPKKGAQTQGSAQGRWVLLTVPVSTYCAGTLTVAHRALAGDHPESLTLAGGCTARELEAAHEIDSRAMANSDHHESNVSSDFDDRIQVALPLADRTCS